MTSTDLPKLLSGSSIKSKQILITGASGWLGRETIAKLQPVLLNDFAQQVTLAGSREATITVNGMVHSIKNLRDLKAEKPWDIVIHLAFLTQDKVKLFGVAEYSQLNRQLSMFVYNLCRESNSKFILVASSGAADPEVLSNYSDPAKKLYGELKRESEDLFMKLHLENGRTVEICRIWSITGAHIQEPQKYAIGNFISQAKSGGVIEIESSKLVTRAYIDGGQLMEVLLLNLLNGKSEILNSGGFAVSLQELAKLVLSELNPSGHLIIPEICTPLDTDLYVPDVSYFNNLSRELGTTLSSVRDQIQITASSNAFKKIIGS